MQSSRFRPGRGAWILLIVSALQACDGGLLQEPPEVSHPNLATMEPQVVETIRDARDAVMKQRKSAGAWGWLGMVFHAHDLKQEAAECYAQAIDLSPEEFKWSYLLATVLQDLDLEEALVRAERASRLKPDYVPAHLLVGQLLEQVSQPQSALEAFGRALSVDSNCTAAEFALGRLHLAEGDLEASQRHLETAARQQPNVGSIHAFLARLYRLQNKEAKATHSAVAARRRVANIALLDPVLEEMLNAAASASRYWGRAKQAEEAGNYQNAEKLYRRASELRPNDASLHHSFGNVLLVRGKLGEAEKHYRRTLELRPENVETLINLGIVLVSRNKLPEAIDLYGKVLEIEPGQVDALVNLAGVLLLSDEVQKAAQHFEKVLESDPDEVDALHGLGQSLLYQNEPRRAVGYLRRALEARPDEGRIHYHLAEALVGLEDFRSAWEHVHHAQGLGESIPEDFLALLQERMPEPRRRPRR